MNSTSPPTGVHARPVATPGRAGAPANLGVEPLPAEQLADPRLGHGHLALGAALGDLARDLAADAADLALELAHAGLARVIGDDHAQRRVGERDLALGQAVALDLARDQVALGDLELLLLGVAGELDHLHPVAQRPGDRVQRVGGGHERHRRQVERQVQVVVAERVVLLGVEHLEHRARRIAAEVRAHLVDLVDHQQRVVGARRRASPG